MATMIIDTEAAPVIDGPAQGHWTYADWERLPEDGQRYEVLDGVLYMTTAPHSFHQWITRRLERFIGIPAEDQGLAYSFAAPFGVLMPGCAPVQPDYVVILKTNAGDFHAGRFWGVPDVIVEVLSPSNSTYDTDTKLHLYERAGVPEYAIIDPRARTLQHYRLGTSGVYAAPQLADESARVTFACLPTIAVPVAELFAGAPDTSY